MTSPSPIPVLSFSSISTWQSDQSASLLLPQLQFRFRMEGAGSGQFWLGWEMSIPLIELHAIPP